MTREEAKSCIGTIEMLQRLAYNIHGVMDVIDADNCKKIIKVLEQEPCEDAKYKEPTNMIDYRRAFKIACELLNGTRLYGVDADKIFEIMMDKDGVVTNDSYEEYILNHLQELDHGQYAIKALEQEPCDNCKYLDGDGCRLVFEFEQFGKASDECPNDNNVSTTVSRGVFDQVRWERDIAIGQLKELGYEFGEKIEPCDNAISRQAVSLNAVKDLFCRICMESNLCYRSKETCEDLRLFDELPSFNLTKTGHWIKKDGYSDCSECGSHIVTEWDYCPKCGAKMVEPQESEKE
jgi:hypothetical protein